MKLDHNAINEALGKPLTLARILDELALYYRGYVVFPDRERDFLCAWTIMTHGYEYFRSIPYVLVDSAEPESGKTTLGELVMRVSRTGMKASSMSPATAFRAIEKWKPTLILDEADRMLGRNANKETAEALIGILNDGYRADGCAYRCVPPKYDPEKFSNFGPKLLIGTGDFLEKSTRSRCVRIHLKPRLEAEYLRENEDDEVLPRGERLKESVEVFAASCDWGALARLEVSRIEGLQGRAWDIWKPLVKIAALAGGGWPGRIERAALALSSTEARHGVRSQRVQLLADTLGLFERLRVDRLASAEFVDFLASDPESEWADYRRGKPLTQRGLAELLKPLEIHSRDVRVADGRNLKGYLREQFEDAFARHLAPASASPSSASVNATALQPASAQAKPCSGSVPADTSPELSATPPDVGTKGLSRCSVSDSNVRSGEGESEPDEAELDALDRLQRLSHDTDHL